MIIKNFQLENNINTIEKYKCLLLYGENDGQKKDIIETIKKKYENSQFHIFFQNEIIKDSQVLFDEVNNVSLFSSSKIILIRDANDKVFEILKEISNKELDNVKLIVTSNILEKKSKLRNYFEKENNLAICPCYEDTDFNLKTYLKNKLISLPQIQGSMIDLIIKNSNNNRQIIQNEINKILCYQHNKKEINIDEIIQLLNLETSKEIDQIINVSILGDKRSLNEILNIKNLHNDDSDLILNTINRKLIKLYEIFKKSEENGTNPINEINNLRPPIFWKEKATFERQIKIWDIKKIVKAIDKIKYLSSFIRKNSDINKDVLIKNILVEISNYPSKSF